MVDDPKQIVGKLVEILTSMRSERSTEKFCKAVYVEEASPLLEKLKSIARTRPGAAYMKEKLSSLESHLKTLGGLEGDNGHSRSDHAGWAAAALNTLKNLFDESD